MFYIGIDPGLNGAIFVSDKKGMLVDIHDIPTDTDKKGKRHVDAKELYSVLLNYKITHAFIEAVHSSPQMGVTSAFSFGRSLGVIQGVMSASEIEYTMIRPQEWKKMFNLSGKDKDLAREKVIHMIPALSEKLKRKKDIDRAESVLIGLCGLVKKGVI